MLGCLIEKQRTTPDVYPLSLNSLRAACNQSTNRDPVVAYDEATIRDALHRLGAAALDALRQRGAGGEVPPPARRDAGAERRGAGAARRADAARAADAGRAAPARRAPVLVPRPGRARGDARGADRARVRRAPRAPPGAEGGPLRAPAERGARGRAGGAGAVARRAAAAAGPPPESRLDRLEREVDALKRQVAELLGRE